ncbi:uncharacterized protein METZ01_LOCUS468514 [marine metagenome]|uniref:Uncharacterized protein n=1 Tax=marine metagenome TaxID=408172 RepID=A0A383B787_9ZZZZ
MPIASEFDGCDPQRSSRRSKSLTSYINNRGQLL